MKVQSLIGRKVNEALSPAPRSDVKVSLLPSLVTRWQLYFKSLRPQRRSLQKYPSCHNHAPVILLNAPLPRIFPSELTFKVIKGRVRFLSVTSSINSSDVVITLGSANALLAVSDEMMPGVVSLPHGWGHDQPGTRLQLAAQRPGANLNALDNKGRTASMYANEQGHSDVVNVLKKCNPLVKIAEPLVKSAQEVPYGGRRKYKNRKSRKTSKNPKKKSRKSRR